MAVLCAFQGINLRVCRSGNPESATHGRRLGIRVCRSLFSTKPSFHQFSNCVGIIPMTDVEPNAEIAIALV